MIRCFYTQTQEFYEHEIYNQFEQMKEKYSPYLLIKTHYHMW